MSLYNLGYLHSKVEKEISKIEKDWEGICLASDNNRTQILRRLSVTQTGDAGSYRDGWIDNFIIDMGKTKEQAVSAYSRFINIKINKFAPGPTERAKRNAAEMETLANMQAEAFGLEEKSLACQLSHENFVDEHRALLQSRDFSALCDRKIASSNKHRRAMEEAIAAFEKADEAAKEACAFKDREIDLIQDPSSRTLEQWGSILDENRGSIQNVHDFMSNEALDFFASEVDQMGSEFQQEIVGV